MTALGRTVILFAVVAGPALAAPLTEAATLFDSGRAAFKAGDFDTACPAFAKSYQLEPVLGTLLNWATCLEKQGHIATAWLRFNDAIEWAGRTHEAEREQFAREHAKALRPSVSWLSVSSASDLEARVDGKPVHVSAVPVSLPVELGAHELSVERDGYEPWSQKVNVEAAGQAVAVVVPALKRLVAAAPAVVSPARASDLSAVSAQHGARLTGGVALIILGSVVTLGGVVGLAWSYSTYDLLQAQRTGSADPRIRVSLEDFDRLRWVPGVSWTGVGVGVAALTAGIVLIATSRTVSISPTFTPGGGGGFVVTGRF